MKYSRPQLHSLTDGGSRGNCANGSAASVDASCQLGPGVAQQFCTAGPAATSSCIDGLAAGSHPNANCAGGSGADTGCGNGNAAPGNG